MRLSLNIAFAALGCAASWQGAYAWGAAGHEIVATIAQMYLHPSVMPTLCSILELPSNKCHLAPVSTWADQHRMQMRWSASLHYVGALDDHPSQTCAFPGTRGWAGNQGINVLDGVKNVTSLLQAWVEEDASDAAASEALKFLIHFVGDLHQPLHLTGRDRGGNSVKVLFDRRHTNLHSLWDGLLIAKAVRTVPRNYSTPLPYPHIERALRGTIYDSYVRRIMWEGVLNKWSDEVDEWLSCPAPSEEASTQFFLSSSSSSPFALLTRLWKTTYSSSQTLISTFLRDGVEITPDGPVICPFFWAQPNHKLNCEIIWPAALDVAPYNVRFESATDDHSHEHNAPYDLNEDNYDTDITAEGVPLLQLDTPEYAGVIEKKMIVEKLLAQGGIRLAGILNYLFADEGVQKREQRGTFLVDVDGCTLPGTTWA